MKERLRDKTRDELTLALNALSIHAAMAERGRPEEKIQNAWTNRSQGIIEVQEGPIRWINCLKHDGSQYSPPQWWTVFGIPDKRRFSEQRAVKIKTVRSKSFPLFGKVVNVSWKGEDHATRLLSPNQRSGRKVFRQEDRRRGNRMPRWGVSGLDRAGQWQIRGTAARLGHGAADR